MYDEQTMTDAAPLFVFAGGGTGGHLYPALAVADAIRERLPDAAFAIFGSQRPIDDRILNSSRWNNVRQSLRPLSAAPWRWPGIYLSLRRARLACRDAFENQLPAIVVGTGGLASVPAVREAARMGIPTAILNPDLRPGRANRHLSGHADVVFAQFEGTHRHLPSANRVVVAGCPVRPAFAEIKRAEGIHAFKLDPQKRTLVVTGASQGARSINEAVLANLDFFAAQSDWQILHLTGDMDHQRVRNAYADRDLSATAIAYTENMAGAFAAADLIISRAGASTLAEITAIGRASILMPYPYHKDQHQRANAECLSRMKAARIMDDKIDADRNGPALRRQLEELCNQADLRHSMAENAGSMGRPRAAEDICDRILDLAGIDDHAPVVTPNAVRAESMQAVSASSR